MNKVAIYAKGRNEEKVNKQIEFCINRIKNELGEEVASNTLIFSDIGTREFKDQVKLHELLELVKNNDINKIYVEDYNIFAFNFDKTFDVCKIFFDNNCDVYSAYSPLPLNKDYLELVNKGRILMKKRLNRRVNKVLIEKSNTIKIYRMLNVEVENLGNNDKDHDNVFWYGGEVAKIKSSQGEYIIIARGIVNCDLIAAKDFINEEGQQIKQGDLIVHFSDKNESGLFKKVMSPYIKNDTDLDAILYEAHELYTLEIDSNNWFELEFYDNKGNLEYNETLDSATLTESIEEVLDMIWTQNKNEKLNAIYCRVGKQSDDYKMEIENQKKLCLNAMNQKDHGNVEVVKVFVDTCPSKSNLKKSFGSLLKEVKENKIKEIFTTDLSRLTRETDKILDIRENLNKGESDIYLVKENKYLVKDYLNQLPSPEVLNSFLEEALGIPNLNDEMDEIEYE